ncbi:MAG: FAD-dependent oxidoreductase [Bacteroidia bacterium]|nr:FAD-dependent oxidoreductase [Bacteroidia bacterium]
MSEKFSLISLPHLFYLLELGEYNSRIFGIPVELIFNPAKMDTLYLERYGKFLETPIGVAAGPHTQLAQNIITAWLCGARYIELKTIQTLDNLSVPKPCIDMQDEGYNCEWSQELSIKESFDQYLNAWIIIHILRKKFNMPPDPFTSFNMSAGYDLSGIKGDKVQWFLGKMKDCSIEKKAKIESLRPICSYIDEIKIPDIISDNITVSTMHGCPPEEIEKIGRYLIEEKKLHTTLKLNPTLLGPDMVHDILNKQLGFHTIVPDEAFEHDLKYHHAIEIINNLKKCAAQNNVFFGIKLTNTLESKNTGSIFGKDVEMMYMSGRALHPIAINLAKKLQNDFKGELEISFCAGADCYNVIDIISCGIFPVTMSSDLLKPGGYGRINQYLKSISEHFCNLNASNIDDFLLKKDGTGNLSVRETALLNLNKYANDVLKNKSYKKSPLYKINIKTDNPLPPFDCIKAPCVTTCPAHQDIPEYLHYVSMQDYENAFRAIIRNNPFPTVLGNVCNHTCQSKCTRINYDEAVMICNIKKFVAEIDDHSFEPQAVPENGLKVAIIGAGPSGLSCAYFLALSGFAVDVYETKAFAGGMISDAIPAFRLTNEAIQKDIKRIEQLGIKIHFNTKVDKRLFDELHAINRYIYIATGVQSAMKLNIEGENAKNVLDALKFLSDMRNNRHTELGKEIVIIGGGNVAIDTARTAIRLNAEKVTIVCLEQKHEMPAYQWEIDEAEEEGILIKNGLGIVKIIHPKGEDNFSKIVLKKCISVFNEKGDFSPEYDESVTDEISCHSVIVCIGQRLDIDFIEKDLLDIDKQTFQTGIKNVYIGGDAYRGSASIIQAVADGRAVAENIIKAANLNNYQEITLANKNISWNQHLLNRTERKYSFFTKKAENAPLRQQATGNMSEHDAIDEALRCLYCDEFCSICETVCPNRANYTYNISPVSYNLQKAVKKNGKIIIEDDIIYRVNQKYQVLNIGDFCNECGNCATFCPTSGAPYRDKPKFYFNFRNFNASDNVYFINFFGGTATIMYKNEREIKTLTRTNEIYFFDTNKVIAKFRNTDFSIIDVSFKQTNLQEITFRDTVEMSILLEAAKDLFFKEGFF